MLHNVEDVHIIIEKISSLEDREEFKINMH